MKNSFRGSMVFLIVAVVLMSAVQVSAFGITSMYWKERPLELKPGEIRDVTLELQNMVGTDAITLEGKMVSGGDIAKITDENLTYYVPAGSKDVLVHLTITVPGDAPLGTEYNIGVSFLEVTRGGQGVAMGSEIEKYFPVIVRLPEVPEATPVAGEKMSAWLIVLIIVIVIIIALVILLLIKQTKKKK